MSARIFLVVAASACLAGPPAARAQSLVPVGGSFSAPVYVTAPPGDGRRLMVVEQGGTVKVVRDGVTLAHPFLSLDTDFRWGGERGLLSIAFSPDYESSRLLYAYFTDAEGDIRVDQFRRAAESRDYVEPGYRRPVIEILHREASNHNGGTALFGPDAELYLATGDGGNAYDEPVRDARDPTSPLGKLLRITPLPGGGYAVPAGNPFAGPGDPGRDEVWSYGLRNPFRFFFDRASGDLFVADVGQSTVEEINHVTAETGGAGRGANFGWDDCEGNLAAEPKPTGGTCPLTGDVRPAISLLQADGYCSVIGGLVVRDRSVPGLFGRYLYGDLCKGRLRSYLPRSPETDREEAGLAVTQPAGFGEDACGRVHVVELSGTVSRLEAAPGGCPLRVAENGAAATTAEAAPPAGVDRAAPILRLGGARRQRLTRRGLLVRARCSEPCSLRAFGVVRLAPNGMRLRLRQVLRSLSAGRSIALRLKASTRSRTAVRRSLVRGRRVTARVTVRARDAGGNLRVARRAIRLRR